MIKASITAYSTAVGPSSDTRNFLTLFTKFMVISLLSASRAECEKPPEGFAQISSGVTERRSRCRSYTAVAAITSPVPPPE